jgi:hypothetical protein
MVLHGLGRESLAALGVQVALDLGGLDAIHRPVAEERGEVPARIAAVGVAHLADRPPLAPRDYGRRVDLPAQPALGLDAGQPSALPGVRLRPIFRLTREPPTRHDPYQLARPPRSTTTQRRPVPYERLATPKYARRVGTLSPRQVGTLLER